MTERFPATHVRRKCSKCGAWFRLPVSDAPPLAGARREQHRAQCGQCTGISAR